MTKIYYEMEKQILDYRANGLYIREIADLLKISTRSIDYVLKKYRCPKEEKINKKNTNSITNFIDLRLLYFCNDIELLCTMFENEYNRIKPKKITIPDRIKKIDTLNKKCTQILKKIKV